MWTGDSLIAPICQPIKKQLLQKYVNSLLCILFLQNVIQVLAKGLVIHGYTIFAHRDVEMTEISMKLSVLVDNKTIILMLIVSYDNYILVMHKPWFIARAC